MSSEPLSPRPRPPARASAKTVSHRTNHFNSKEHASTNVLRNAKATFRGKTPKTLENARLRQAAITVLGWFDKISSPPLLRATSLHSKTFFFKNNYSNPPLEQRLHSNPPFLFLWFPNWHLPDFREGKNVNFYKMSSSCLEASPSRNSSYSRKVRRICEGLTPLLPPPHSHHPPPLAHTIF